MASYNYEVVQPDGKDRKGTIEAASREAAITELRASGNLIVSLDLANALNKDLDINIGKVVKARELSVFCRQFQSVLNAGVTVMEALGMLAKQTSNRSFQAAIEDVRDTVQRGETLAEAMSQHPKVFPELMIHMVAAGEASGSLDVAFDRVAKQYEKDSHLAGMVKKSMVYPVILIIVIIGVVAIMMIKIVPTFTETFADIGVQLPWITRAVMGVSDFLVHSWYFIAGGAAVIGFLIHEVKKTERGAMFFGQLGLMLPLFGNLTVKSASASFARTLSTLMASGLSMMDSIGIIEKTIKNAVVRTALRNAQKEVSEGVPLSIPLERSGVFPPMVYQMVRIGEETGNMEEMLDKISDYYDEEVEMATQALVAALEPMIIIVMAMLVVPIILAIMLPMFSMNTQF